MKANNTKFKKLSTLAVVLPFMILVACQGNELPGEAAQSVQTKNVTSTSDAVAPYNTSSDTSSSMNDTDFSEFANALQGTWERTTYPYGTIEFNNNQVKFTQGEGAVEAPKFENFNIADECPIGDKAKNSALAYDFLVVEDKYCNAIKLNADVLSILYSKARDGIKYKKVSENISTTTSPTTVPINFRGKWAMTQKSCQANNNEQIQITDSKIIYFKNDAKLVAITQFEPTRLEANFDYRMDNNKSKDYFYTLDLKDQQKVLIMRENGDNARSGPIRYEKCL